MGYASRTGRHDNAIGEAVTITREHLIEAKAYLLQRQNTTLVANMIAGGERQFVERAMWANQDGLSRAENEEVYRRLCKGSILPDGADDTPGPIILPCQN